MSTLASMTLNVSSNFLSLHSEFKRFQRERERERETTKKRKEAVKEKEKMQ